jgi:hypothetical protein
MGNYEKIYFFIIIYITYFLEKKNFKKTINILNIWCFLQKQQLKYFIYFIIFLENLFVNGK